MSEEIEKESLAILFIILSLLTSLISQYLTKRTGLYKNKSNYSTSISNFVIVPRSYFWACSYISCMD